MFGALQEHEIRALLRKEQMGRLGIAAEGKVYVFPVSYGFDGANLYFQSREGTKVQLMRDHPAVCFEVEDVTSPAIWRTVMVHGTYREVVDPEERDRAFSLILCQGEVTAPPSVAPYTHGPEAIVVFTIAIDEITGRFEHDYPVALRRPAGPA